MFGSTDFTLLGVSWILAGSVLVGLVRRYWVKAPEEGIKVGAALWMVLGMVIDKTLKGEVWQFPTTFAGWFGLGLQCLIYFGSILGLVPGQTAGRVYRASKAALSGVKSRIVGR